MKVIARNKKASYNYYLLDTFEAGIVLVGTEIKSIRAGKVSIADAYCLVKNDEMVVVNMHIAKYAQGNIFNHNETRTRKLLLHKKEIRKIGKKVATESLTIVPTQIYIDKGLAKLEIAIAKGKKNYDKRQTLKEKAERRTAERNLRGRY